jgi:hypothetical protein
MPVEPMRAVRPRPPASTRGRGLAVLLALLALALPAAPALAQSSFIARADRTQVRAGDPFIYEVTLSLESGRADGYRKPDFKGFRVMGEQPSTSTQVQMGGGASFMRTVYTWTYELVALQPGRATIGPARVRAGGRELKTDGVTVSVVAGGGAPAAAAPAPRRRQLPGFRSPFDDLFGGGDDQQPDQRAGETSFVRVVPDKTTVYVGEALTVDWALYSPERQDHRKLVTAPRTDGFWSEDLPVSQADLLTQQTFEGRVYLASTLMRRALFPLQAGKLTITPLELETAQLDFFGRAVRSQRLRTEPLTIEALPLPTAGRPADFDPANVGHFTVEAKVDRSQVRVGEAVTLTVALAGQGNLRKLATPKLPPLEGWKSYEPKVDVKLEAAGGITGSKTVEFLLLPERAGTTMIPAFELSFFDPASRAYRTERSLPVRIEVSGDGAAASKPGSAPALGAPVAGVENLLPTELRPPRARATLRRDLGTTFYRSQGFLFALGLPPGLLLLTVAVGRLRERLTADTARGRRRKTRRLVRQRLRAAEAHLEAGRPAPFYIEIDRVLREVLTARLGREVAGLSRDELAARIVASGMPAEVGGRIIAELEECDRARFAPGSTAASDLRASLERAAELILMVEKAPVRAEAAA